LTLNVAVNTGQRDCAACDSDIANSICYLHAVANVIFLEKFGFRFILFSGKKI